jgi:hypothetical protein
MSTFSLPRRKADGRVCVCLRRFRLGGRSGRRSERRQRAPISTYSSLPLILENPACKCTASNLFRVNHRLFSPVERRFRRCVIRNSACACRRAASPFCRAGPRTFVLVRSISGASGRDAARDLGGGPWRFGTETSTAATRRVERLQRVLFIARCQTDLVLRIDVKSKRSTPDCSIVNADTFKLHSRAVGFSE